MIYLLFIGISSAETTKPDANKLLEYRIDENKANIEKSNAQIKENIQCTKSEIEKSIAEQKEIMSEKLNLYIFFVGGALALIGFLLNYFGKDNITKWINTQIKKNVESKVTYYTDKTEMEITIKNISREILAEKKDAIQKEFRQDIDVLIKQNADIIKQNFLDIKDTTEDQYKKLTLEMKNLMGAKLDIKKPMTDELKESLAQYTNFLKENFEENDYSKLDFERLGFYTYYIKQYSEAERYYRILSEKEPENARWNFYVGLCLLEKKEYIEAIEEYNIAISKNNDYADAYYNKGVAHQRLKQYDKAIEAYSKTIDINPNDSEAYTNRGTINTILKKYSQAIEDFRKSIAINPIDNDVYFNLIELYIVNNQHQIAKEYFEILNKQIQKPEDKVGYLYLQIIVQILDNVSIVENRIEFEKKLEEEFKLEWNFDIIDNWINTAEIDEDKRKRIIKIIDLLKAKPDANK